MAFRSSLGSRELGRHHQVVRTTRIAGGAHAQFAGRVGAQEVALARARLDTTWRLALRTPSSSNGELPLPRKTCGSS
jgi:hypothetical protein